MHKITTVLSGSFLVFALSSCGGIGTYLGPAEELKTIPHDMFYQTTGNCAQGDLEFIRLQAAGIKLWTDPSAVLMAQQELYLHQDLSFDVRYREFDMEGVTFDKRLHSKVSLDSATGAISLSGLGTGQIVEEDGRKYLEVNFRHNVNSPELVGKTARFRITKSFSGLDTDRAQYCGY
ncbi:hypothetical protein EZJ49_11895 [Bdellovibrio bacteriovorus]|uniref:hypothetical protein n=1 Tax=Bdellovibrio bacteriovorus TaxID=959 RepID=UPI0021D04868|nr:hypothetical protein [Bdellovibrio bacteriovorus]UXR63766.1 hypothetical protein EZJ49_11895 [Bdellovibrio bacteriovorus]